MYIYRRFSRRSSHDESPARLGREGTGTLITAEGVSVALSGEAGVSLAGALLDAVGPSQ